MSKRLPFTHSLRSLRVLFAIMLFATLFFVPTLTAHAANPAPDTAQATKAASWLETRVNSDGGFGRDAKGVAKSSIGGTANAIFALVAAGVDPASVKQANGKSPLDYLQANAAAGATDIDNVSKTILALRAVSLDPGNFGGVDFYAKLNGFYNSASGQFVNPAFNSIPSHFFAVLALAAGHKTIPTLAVTFIKSVQVSDGSFGFTGTEKAGEGDTNDTAFALMALHAAGDTGSMERALTYLKAQQNPDAGFPFQKPSQYGTDSDANSTAVVIQGLLVAGVDLSTFAQGGKTPLAALVAFQNSDGSFAYQTTSPGPNELATVQALPALVLQPLPVKAISTAFVPATPTPGAGTPTAVPTTPATTVAGTPATTTAAPTTPTVAPTATIAPATTVPTTEPATDTPSIPGGLPETGRGGSTGSSPTNTGGLLLVALVLACCILTMAGAATVARKRR